MAIFSLKHFIEIGLNLAKMIKKKKLSGKTESCMHECDIPQANTYLL